MNEAEAIINFQLTQRDIRRYLTDIDSAIVGGDGTNKNVYSSVDNVNFLYTRNSSFWAKNINGIDAFAVYVTANGNTGYSGLNSCALIAPDVVLYAAHTTFPINYGPYDVYFVDKLNNTIKRTIAVGAYNQIDGTDMVVGKLNSPITSINPIPVSVGLRQRFIRKWEGGDAVGSATFPTDRSLVPGVLVWTIHTGSHIVGVDDITYFNNDDVFVSNLESTVGSRGLYTNSRAGGDSGCPACLALNNQLFLVCQWHFNDAYKTWSTNLSAFVDQIDNAVILVGSTNKVTRSSLSLYSSSCSYYIE